MTMQGSKPEKYGSNLMAGGEAADVYVEVEQDYAEAMASEMRNGFIRKVFSLLTLQLLATVIIASFFRVKSIAPVLHNSPTLMILSTIGSFVFLIALVCCKNVAKKAPGNYILLGCFTLCMGLMMGFSTAYFDDDVVLMAGISTMGIVCGLTIYAFTTKTDFTGYGAYLSCLLTGLIFFGLCVAIFRSTIGYIIGSSIGAMLFSCYLVYDLQCLMIGKRGHTYTPDDYILATISL